MARFFVILFGLQSAVWTAISIPILKNARGFPGRHIFSGCLYVAPSYIFVGWVPGFIFESILVVLTIHKGLKYRVNDLPPTVEVLIRDSVVYFLSVNIILAFNIFYSIFGEKLLASSLFLPSGVVTSVAAARLTMNIRQFTMEEGMAALDVTLRSFMPAALTQDNDDVEPGIHTMRPHVRTQGSIPIEQGHGDDRRPGGGR
ncbi:hypothetical protein M413DRAFT_442316 [Hebeloma cylindrosporum]|uniref:Uncharacterized protein n=1 Tax=Hebeloma cylindrosporum TaxID=76867 RepID=A0A0C2Y762_HEBCY|nr:hypothetical protein M413DRAFT_442316 [Hebeloma cylindrosporum h7]